MSANRFYAPTRLSPGGEIALPPDQARHAATVRRLGVGDAVVLFDGRGCEATGRISKVEPRGLRVVVEYTRRCEPDALPLLTLAVALPKGPRQDVLVEKCTELGVQAIWPMHCARSVARPSVTRIEKLRRTTVEACKQSRRCWLPEVADPQSFPDVLAQAGQFDGLWLAHPGASDACGGQDADRTVLVLVGPEGGFTDDELQQADAATFQRCHLGTTLLRSETAAIAAAARWLCRTTVAAPEAL